MNKKFILFGALFLAACSTSPDPLEGTWVSSGGDGENDWRIEYEFKNGHYTLDAYPPMEAEGHYSFESETEVILDDGDRQQNLEWDPEGQSFTLNGNIFTAL